jgi:hypothetical protein
MNRSEVYLIKSKSRQGLADSFMRFQEYYESPVFSGKTFTIEEFANWYSAEFGGFTYAKDWSGFNIPSWVLKPFRDGHFDPLTNEEKQLMNSLKKANGDFYVIGVCEKDKMCIDTLKHEFAHASFNNNLAYRQEVASCVDSYDTRPIKSALKNMGYHNKVVSDEVNAYMLTEPETMEDVFSIGSGEKIQNILGKIFYKYFGYSLYDAEPTSILNRIKTIRI